MEPKPNGRVAARARAFASKLAAAQESMAEAYERAFRSDPLPNTRMRNEIGHWRQRLHGLPPAVAIAKCEELTILLDRYARAPAAAKAALTTGTWHLPGSALAALEPDPEEQTREATRRAELTTQQAHETLDALLARLAQRGVKVMLLDGSPVASGALSHGDLRTLDSLKGYLPAVLHERGEAAA